MLNRSNRATLLKWDILLQALNVAVSCGYDTWFAVRLVMDYTAYTQKLTISTLAVKLSVSAIIHPWWTATLNNDSAVRLLQFLNTS